MSSFSNIINLAYLNKFDIDEENKIYVVDCLIEDIHKDKDLTSNYILNHRKSDDFIQILLNLLNHSNSILVGNVAFILGTLLEFNVGRNKILKTLNNADMNPDNFTFYKLLNLLNSTDNDVVMNIAGALGTLVESQEGRDYLMIKVDSFDNFLKLIQQLLLSENLWTGSNAALLIARLSIDKEGIQQIINCSSIETILQNLVYCLGSDTAGRGMNSAFAIGRLLDDDKVWRKYWQILNKHKIMNLLIEMTSSSDLASVKNSCFCLSTIISKRQGLEFLITNKKLGEICLESFIKNLSLTDEETVWFILMTIKTMSKHVNGINFIRKYPDILEKVKRCKSKSDFSEEIKDECDEIIMNLSPLPTPDHPIVKLLSATNVSIAWTFPKKCRKQELRCHLYYKQNNEEVLVYRGTKNEMTVNNLEPNTRYEFYIQYSDHVELSASSNACSIITGEIPSSPPTNLRTVNRTPTQIKVAWDEPENLNGIIKCYHVILNKTDGTTNWKKVIKRYLSNRTIRYTNSSNKSEKIIDQTQEKSIILSGLIPETKYTISVYAVNNGGKSEPMTIEACTSASGAHAPNKPNVVVLGRMEVHISWDSPEEVLGRLFRYDVLLNRQKTVYSGTDMYCRIDGLKSNTEYTFSVVAVTSEGRFESPCTKKKTNKDEYAEINRQPLFPKKNFQTKSSKSSYRTDSVSSIKTSDLQSSIRVNNHRKSTVTTFTELSYPKKSNRSNRRYSDAGIISTKAASFTYDSNSSQIISNIKSKPRRRSTPRRLEPIGIMNTGDNIISTALITNSASSQDPNLPFIDLSISTNELFTTDSNNSPISDTSLINNEINLKIK